MMASTSSRAPATTSMTAAMAASITTVPRSGSRMINRPSTPRPTVIGRMVRRQSPSSRRRWCSIVATHRITESFANSDGWKLTPAMSNHRAEPLTDFVNGVWKSTTTRPTEVTVMSIGASLARRW